MATLNLPPWLSDGIRTIQWPLDEKSYPRLHLKSMNEMKEIRRQERMADDCDTCTCMEWQARCSPTTFQEFTAHMPESLEWVLPQENGDPRSYGLISVALVLLGNGFADEAHCILAPLSYPQELPFGYGPSAYSTISEEARSYASYVHGLVHRREGNHIGEFGKAGFFNANYWSSIVFRSPGLEALPHFELCRQISMLAESYSSCASIQKWYTDSRLNAELMSDEAYFEARYMHSLCKTVLNNGSSDPVFQQFAEQACETEVRVMLAETLRKSGLFVTQDSQETQQQALADRVPHA